MCLHAERWEEDVKNLVNMVVDMYVDACAYEASVAWGDESLREKADVAWSRYEGARTLLSMVFNITEDQVDDDMQVLMYERVF